ATITWVRNGANPVDVYGRPFNLVWRELADLPREPGSIDKAIQDGLDRAVQTAVTDVQLTKTHTSQQVIQRTRGIAGYRRVLEGAYSCGLCIVDSTQRYHKKDLLPIHPGCDCSAAEIYADEDPAAAVNEYLLGDIHAAIAERFGASSPSAREIPGALNGKGQPLMYRDVIIVHQHGELGPILGVRGQDFTGLNDLGGGV
ncbi:MAG: hypothetical protein JWO67_4167, partial [Streptosporangiaceae bacterium]|nr:hypothetical protein [Streptosporangiaceae bacterium]